MSLKSLLLNLVFQGFQIKHNITAEKPRRRAEVPKEPTIGKSPLAKAAPDCIDIIAITTATMDNQFDLLFAITDLILSYYFFWGKY